MKNSDRISVNSPLGRREIDAAGAAVGVVHMDPDQSYAGVGSLLQAYINGRDERAWDSIKAKIDYTYQNLDFALGPLEAEMGFARDVLSRVNRGQKLLFKPNLVMIVNIDPQTHGSGQGSTTCTEWPFVAALMRWFHDKLGITYHQMSVGEAASSMCAVAGYCSMLNPSGQPVTTEAVIEGKAGDFYGGWGFYFVRRYLAETHDASHADDPLQGYEESVAGTYIPPGLVSDKLMVYDLNRIYDEPSKGRDVDVPDGVNFQSITLHKAVVGGDSSDPKDRKAYPGCILVNVPKFKVHAQALFTNVIKNLGIGLYPMQSTKNGEYQWDYAVPYSLVPGIKGGVPHQVWDAEVDHETSLPKRDAAGNYVVRKTGGMPGTMVDIIKAVSSQDTFMIHVVDGIEAINLDHTGMLPGTKQPEGVVFAGLDPVATDLLCARYMFSNVPLTEALTVELNDGHGGRFPQRVPVPVVEGQDIVTRQGYDCPLSRDITFAYAEKRGVGRRSYYVVGSDAVTGRRLVSMEGHLGSVSDGAFFDVVTPTMYYATSKMAWDLQRTAFQYLEAIDKLAGSSLKQEFLAAYDEDGDGVVGYEEFGKKGIFGPGLYLLAMRISLTGTDPLGELRGIFLNGATSLKCSDTRWNTGGHDVFKEHLIAGMCLAALNLSQIDLEAPDPFLPGLTWGKGKWPSYELASYLVMGIRLYGTFPLAVGLPGLYGTAFCYADLTQNDGLYVGPIRSQPNADAVTRYLAAVASGEAKPLDFTFYVPPGYGSVAGQKVPNVEETTDRAKVFTASFGSGAEVWPAVTL